MADDGNTRSVGRRARLIGGTTGIGVALGAGIAGWTQGGLAPAIGGAVGGVASLFGAVVLDQRLQRDAERENARKARDGALTSLKLDPRATAAGALTLLRAAQCPIRFYGRVAESAMLARWDVSPVPRPEVAERDRHPVIVITGEAGVGKSRLAYQHGLDLPAEWARGEVRPGRGGDVVRLAREAGDPTLIVVDDGEGNPDFPPLLEELAEHSSEPLIRVLVTARSLEGVRSLVVPRLQERHRHILEHAPALPLLPHGEADDRRRWFGEAVETFARAQGVEPPHVGGHIDGNEYQADEALLVLFAQALLTVLNAAAVRDRVPDARTLAIGQVARALFDHEKARWGRSPLLPTGLDEVTQARVVTALMLLDADTEEAAVTALRAVPDLGDASQERLRSIARWASSLYTTGSGFAVDLRPDLLADWFILDQLCISPSLAGNLAQVLEGGAPELMLRRLARAANRDPQALDLLATVIAADPTRLSPIAVRAALGAGHAVWALDRHLALIIKNAVWSSDDLTALQATFPSGLFLYSLVEVLTLKIEAARAHNDLLRLADSLNNLGLTLGYLGRHHERLPVAEEATTLYRTIAANNPAHLPNLAGSLINLSNALGDLGRYHEQLPMAEEVTTLNRTLAANNPAHLLNLPNLASSLNNLSNILGYLGRHHEQLLVAEEATTLDRTIAANNPTHLPKLAGSLNNLSNALDNLGRHHEQLLVAEEATTLYRTIAANNPAHLPNLASSLNNLGVALGDLGRHHERLPVAEEATTLYRTIAANNPAHLPNLASSLNNLSNALDNLGRHHEQLPVAEEATTLNRTIAANNPAHLPNLASSLNNLGVALNNLGQSAKALSTQTEAVNLYGDLAQGNPDRYGPTYRELLAALRKLYSERGLTDKALLLHLPNREQTRDQTDQ